MKYLFKHSVLILTTLFMMGCANTQPISSEPTSSDSSIKDDSVSYANTQPISSEPTSSDSSIKDDSVSYANTQPISSEPTSSDSSIKDDSVSYDAFKTEVDKFGDITYTKAVFKYEITEKIEGTPLETRDSSETGTVTSVLEFERTPDGNNKITSDTTKTQEAKKLTQGYPNDIKGWFKWQTQRKNEAEKSDNLAYSDKFYLNPLKASMTISSDRPGTANATFEGTYQGTSINTLTFNEKGLVVKIEEEVKTDIDGTVTSSVDGTYQTKGHYERVAVATITYTD